MSGYLFLKELLQSQLINPFISLLRIYWQNLFKERAL